MKSKIYTCSSCGIEGELNIEFKAEAKKKKESDEDLMVCDGCREEMFQKKK